VSELTARLVRQAQLGSQEAFAELYRQYCSQLYYFACKRLISDDQASDCVQSSFLYALVHIEELQKPESFRAWLYKICSSEIASVFKAQKRFSGEFSLDDMTEDQQSSYEGLQISEEDAQGDTAAVEEDLDAQCDDLLSCLNQLTDLQKDMIILRYYGGLEPIELAAALDISPAAARKRLHDAMAALRKACGASGRQAEMDATVTRLLQHDAEAAQLHGDRPEGPIALGMGVVLPELLKSAPEQTWSRAQAFLAAARTGDVSALVQNPAAIAAQVVTGAGAGVFLGSLAGKIGITAAGVLVVAGLGYGGYQLFGRPATPAPDAVVAQGGAGSVPKSTEATGAGTQGSAVTSETAETVDADAATGTGAGASGAVSTTTRTDKTGTGAPQLPAPSSGAPAAAQVNPSLPAKPPAPQPSPAPASQPPVLTAVTTQLSYALGTALTSARLIADSGAVAHSAAGTALTVSVSNFNNIDTTTPGTYLVFLHATDASTGMAAPVVMLSVWIQG